MEILPMYKDITELYCFIDDFCQAVDHYVAHQGIAAQNQRAPTRTPDMRISEIVTIMILFQQSPCKNFKYFYQSYLQHYKEDLCLVSYNRFVELQKRCLIYCVCLQFWFCQQNSKGRLHFIDATKIQVCHNKRITQHKVFKGLAAMSKTTMGWFYGFKLHLVINEKGEIQGVALTSGNVDDRAPVDNMTKRLQGLLFGDKGYIQKNLFQKLYQRGLKFITNFKNNMKNKLMILEEKILLKKRSLIESVFDVSSGLHNPLKPYPWLFPSQTIGHKCGKKMH